MPWVSDIHIIWNACKNDKFDDKNPLIIKKLDLVDNRVSNALLVKGYR